MKKNLLFLLLAVMAFASSFAALAPLHLRNNQLKVDYNDSTVYFHGFTTVPLHQLDSVAYLTDAHAAYLKEIGANAIRFVVSADDKRGGYIQSPEANLDKAKNCIDWAMKNDLYAVIAWDLDALPTDTIKDRERYDDPITYKTEANEFFGEIAKHISNKKYGGKVLYELGANLGIICSREDIKKYSENLMNTVLMSDANALCIVPSAAWGQKVLELVQNGLDIRYRDRALYSFNYYAQSHRSILGDLASASMSAPIIITKWSPLDFAEREDSFDKDANDALLETFAKLNKQISWFYAYWGNESASSYFKKDCASNSVPDCVTESGKYIYNVLQKQNWECLGCSNNVFEVIPIPSDPDHPFDWRLYNKGGEGIAYHDGNGYAYDFIFDDTKDVKQFYAYRSNTNYPESDCLSEATKLYGAPSNPYYSEKDYEKGWADSEDCCWERTADGSCAKLGHKTLNAGVYYTEDIEYFNHGGSYDRAYEGVDYWRTQQKIIDSPNNELDVKLKENYYATLGEVEPREWINYTVDVKYAGYYKVYALVSSHTESYGSMSFRNNDGNMVRDIADIYDWDKYTELNPQDAWGEIAEDDFDHFMWKQLIYGDDWNDLAGVYFRKTGKQQLTILFNEPVGAIGPLYFVLWRDENGGIVEPEALSPLTVYPNPTSGEFVISLGGGEQTFVSIVDMLGRTVYAVETSDDNVSVSKKLASGIYTVSAKSDKGVRTTRLIVK